MFDFIFKKRAAAKLFEEAQVNLRKKELAESARAIVKLAEQQSEKQSELAKAARFAGQEDAAAAFILRSEFADARLKAVMHIRSPELLKQVSQAMRNKDRRVSKLVQEKLAEIQHQQQINSEVQACLIQGQRLLEDLPLMANQVAEWDKKRLALGEHGLSLLEVKVTLENRLQVQLDLQRQVMQAATGLRALVQVELIQEETLEKAQAQLAGYRRQWQQIQSHALLASLPQSQLNQFNSDMTAAQTFVQQLTATAPAISVPELQDIATLSQENDDEKKRTKKHEKKKKIVQTASVDSVDMDAVLLKLEHALEEGSLQQALDLDKSLRKVALPTHGEVVQRLNALRAELTHLLDWAKWGGNVSREELINVADNLSGNKLTASEIAKQVGGLRSRWKELDRTSGAAHMHAHTLWERFDKACNNAYQIADAHFKQQAQLRTENSGLAKLQLAAMDEVIADRENRLPDWKAHQLYINQVKLEWRKLGSVDRKLKAQLDVEFNQKFETLQRPLAAARDVSIGVRQQLITAVAAINPGGRDAAERVKQMQQRWQQEALNLPLRRKDEQDLWNQFRTACDAVFAQRKANVEEQHQLRDQILLAKQTCCEELEENVKNSSQLSGTEIVQVLRTARQAWRDLSKQVFGKHKPDDGDARFDAALNKLEQRYSELVAEEKKAALANLRAKINLCRQVESGMVDRQAEWPALETNLLSAELNKCLMQRFKNAIAAHENQRDADVKDTDVNSAQIEEQLLRIELFRGLPSPPELAQQRLQLQVQGLQSAMKNRDVSSDYLSNFYALCASSVNLNAQQEQRFQMILDDHGKQ